MYSIDDDFVDEGTQSTDTSNTGGGNFLDIATAVIDAAGNVIQILDGEGNDITDEVDTVDIPDQPTATDNTTLYWILGSAFFFILLLMAFLLLRKKK